MKIKIINKNPLSGSYRNVKSWVIDEGFTYTKTYNETLDSAVVRISHLTSKIDIEPFDEVLLFDDNRIGEVYLCVDSYKLTQDSLGAEITYTYEINLFSQTKLLENKILPNLTITNTKNKRSVWYYLDEYLYRYGEKRRQDITSTQYLDYEGETETITGQEETSGQYDLYFGDNYIGYEMDTDPSFDINVISGYESSVSIEDYSWDSETARLSIYYFVEFDCDFTVSVSVEQMYKINHQQQFIDRFTYKTGTDSVQSKFDTITCPEMQWNAPTLREVITDLMMIGDCIPVVKNGVISYLDLTKTNDPITNYNYIQESQSSDDYVSDIKMDLKNVMQTSVEGITNTTTTTEYITFTTDSSKITTDNLILKTQFPILSIKHLWICIPASTNITVGDTSYLKEKYVKIDLCEFPELSLYSTKKFNLISEYKEYQTKDIIYKTILMRYDAIIENTVENYFSKYQLFNLYYNRGSNIISGFTQTAKAGITGQKTTFEWLRMLALTAEHIKNPTSQIAINNINSINENQAGQNRYTYPFTFFQIEYETMTDQSFSAGKSNYPTNYREIVDNQTNSWVDSYNQGNLEYQKANRLGNKQVLINQRYVGSGKLMNIGDTYNDNIVYQVQYQVFTDHIEVNGYATKQYILRNYYTGINSKIRTWKNATDEAVIRSDLIKYYYEFSYTPKEEYNMAYVIYNRNLPTYLLSGVKSFTAKPIKYALTQTYSAGRLPSSTSYYSLNTLNRIIGNSVVFSFGYDDNAYVGKHIRNSDDYEGHRITVRSFAAGDIHRSPQLYIDDVDDVGGTPLELYNYAKEEENYETTETFFKLTDEIDLAEGGTNPFTAQDNLRVPLLNVLGKPLVKNTEATGQMYFNQSLYIHKDNREIPFINLQLEFCSDSPDIYFTKQFLQRIKAVSTVNRGTPKIYVSDTYKYGNETLPTDATLISGAANITVGNENQYKSAYLRVGTGAIQVSANRYIYITDENDKVLIVFKTKRRSNEHEIYLNMLRLRNKSYYDANGIKLGEI